MSYQGASAPLAVELRDLFSDILQFKQTTTSTNNRDKIDKIRKLVRSKSTRDRFAGIVKKYTGLNLKFRFFGQGPTYIFATSLETADALKDYTGDVEYTRYQSDAPYGDEERKKIEKARAAVDRDLAKIIDTKSAQGVIATEAKLFFCIDTAFCLDLYHEKAVPFTAEEITAVVLHEIGHTLSVIDYASFMYRSLQEYTAPVRFNIRDEKDISKNLKKARQTVANYEKKKGSDELSKTAHRAILKLEDLLEDKPNLNIFKTAICGLAAALLMVVLFPITLVIMLDMIMQIWSDDVLDMIEYNRKNLTKDSDFKHTRKELTDIEFRADEFVSAFGYTQDLIRALDKFGINAKVVTPSYAGKGAPYHKGQTMLPYHMNHIMAVLMAPYMAITESHGTDEARFSKMQRTMLKQMKGAELPPELMEDLVIQYQNVKTIIEAEYLHARKNFGLYQTYANIARMLLTGGGLLNLLVNGKADKHYVELMDTAEKMFANELTFQRRRLELV